MDLRTVLCIALVLLLTSSGIAAEKLVGNPMGDFDAADPCILRSGGKTYLYNTSYGSGRGAYPIRVSENTDLSTWTLLGSIFKIGNYPDWTKGSVSRYWAPEVHRVQDRYVCYFSATDKRGEFCIGTAVSKSPTGPFVPQKKPLASHSRYGLIDATYFRDTATGRRYVSWKEDRNALSPKEPTGLVISELTEDGLKCVGKPRTLLKNDAPWEGPLVEGASFLYRNGYYYLFYSGNVFSDDSYGVGVARSKKLLGPYGKYVGNPILRSDDDFSGPGHQFLVRESSGDWTMFYHARDKSLSPLRSRLLMSDPIDWDTNNWPKIYDGTPSKNVVGR